MTEKVSFSSKRFLLTLMLFVFSFSVSAFAQRYDNFAGIPFFIV